MSISADLVKTLREKTGVGFMECKSALAEAKGDLEAAVTILRKKGLSASAKKAGRETKEGLIGCYVHNGKIGVMVELNCESDFVARNTDFQALIHDIAMHIAASDPRFIRKEDVTEDVLAKEREIYRAQMGESKKPPEVLEKIITGKLQKYYEEACLLEQNFVKDPARKISQLLAEAVAKTGENIQVRQFARYKIGEE